MAALGKPGLVEHPRAPAMREPGEVARVEPDRRPARAPARAASAPPRWRAATPVERVVGVDEEHAVAGQRARVRHERLALVVVEHHPAVRVRPPHRDPVEPARQRVRGGRAAAHVRRPARGEAAVDPLRAPQPELEHRLAARRRGRRGPPSSRPASGSSPPRGAPSRAACTGRPARDPQQRLLREHDRALRHRVDVHVHLERGASASRKPRSKSGAPSPPRCAREEGEVLLVEAQLLDAGRPRARAPPPP